MKVIILAAGMGSRLRPYTNDIPKCMVPLAGKPMLHRQLEVLRNAGLNDITIVGGYKYECLKGNNTQVVFNQKYDITNMVYTLFCVQEQMVNGEDILITYGDIVFEPEVLNKVLDTEGDVVLGADLFWRRLWEMRMDNPLSDAETFKMKDTNQVIELGKKPDSYDDAQAQYMGIIKINAKCVEALKAVYNQMDQNATYDGQDFNNMYMTSFIQHLIDIGWEVKAALVKNGWIEIDTNDELDIYNSHYNSGALDSIVRLT
ncbi:NTP transferase domain-containing protein [Marinomonas algicola]|uniref:phosphocholine cytidylyltransferase family protein n=1 Tax=Marinomonas algicola TaxID=2773454 RepID=UPI001748A505|nr:phosphocholine cytidylyltransferase family protein [Marinomonas algicola]